MTRLLCLSSLAATALATVAGAAELPLKRVVLFSSGVGFFSREGPVEGTATVELSFRTAQINDILKSMVLQDRGGGTIAPVTYAPQEPLERTLSSFAIDISDNPTLAELLNRLRGVKAEVKSDALRLGTVVGVEQQQKSVGPDSVVTFDVLNLLTDAGLVQVPIWQLKSIRVLDPKVDSDLHKALQVIASGRDKDKRPVSLTFSGTGTRQVTAGYLLETPVWKTSYRLVAEEEGLFLQGWSIVENTTDEDWTNVGLSLVSGRPISFTQNLYEPLYVPRPDVPPSVMASPRPQVYEGAMEDKLAEAPAMTEEAEEVGDRRARRAASLAAPAPPPAAAPGGLGGGGYGGGSGYGGFGYGVALADAGVAAMAQAEKVGELFQYAIDQPVTIGRQKSAMIPIVNKPIEGEKVSVYNQSVNPRFPLNGIRLKNTTGLHLMGGPITVFDGGIYAGDALIEDVAPGDDRLLTYAVDLGVEVEPKTSGSADEIVSVRVARGVVVITRKEQAKVVYTAKNVSGEKKAILIEQPFRADWTLIEPKEASERTRSVYRFKVEIDAKSSKDLTVVEEHPVSQVVALTDADADQVGLFLRMDKLTEAVKQALQRVVELKGQLAQVQRDRADREARLAEITTEQDRIRKNMEQLDRNSELYKQYVEKLGKQEQEFESLQGEIRQLKADEEKKLQEIQDFILNLNIE